MDEATHVMLQAIKVFDPVPGKKIVAMRAAVHAVEREVIPKAAVSADSFDRDKLLSAALDVWNMYVRLSRSRLFPQEIQRQLPILPGQEDDPLCSVRFFTPDADITWYPLAFDGLATFFGYVVSTVYEFKYFTLSELEEYRGPLNLAVERDELFQATRLSEIRKLHGDKSEALIFIQSSQPGTVQEVLDAIKEEALERPFVITSVNRMDLLECGATEEQLAALTDEDMQTIARNMEATYVAESFWFDLREAANAVLTRKGFPQLPEESDDEQEE